MTTKERILNEALRLFSEKGYADVSVADIAEVVGIKAPSLYKHFKGKQEIFDSCVSVFLERMNQIRSELLLPGTPNAEISYENAGLEEIKEISIGLFMFYLKDSVASGLRKMLMIERYRNPQINDIFENVFVVGAVDYEEQIFAELIKSGVIRNEDPHVIAIRFYAPVLYLLQKYDMCPEREDEAKEELCGIIEEFCRTYKG